MSNKSTLDDKKVHQHYSLFAPPLVKMM